MTITTTIQLSQTNCNSNPRFKLNKRTDERQHRCKKAEMSGSKKEILCNCIKRNCKQLQRRKNKENGSLKSRLSFQLTWQLQFVQWDTLCREFASFGFCQKRTISYRSGLSASQCFQFARFLYFVCTVRILKRLWHFLSPHFQVSLLCAFVKAIRGKKRRRTTKVTLCYEWTHNK